MLIHEKEILISKEHLDQNNHVNNVQFVAWLEMMVAEHWNLLKHKSLYEKDIWFLAEHHIEYKKQVFPGETLTVKTYPEVPEGVKQPRKVEFYREGELVVDSRTKWILLDFESKKIKRLAQDWLKDFE